MNSLKKACLEERIRLVQEWKNSGLTQTEFARLKGIEIGDFRNQIRYVRRKAPENLNDTTPSEAHGRFDNYSETYGKGSTSKISFLKYR